MGYEWVFIALMFGLATGIIGRAKGSSFFIWLIVGTIIPGIALIAVFMMRNEENEPERRCENCGKILKLYVQVCPRCGYDLYLPEPEQTRMPPR